MLSPWTSSAKRTLLTLLTVVALVLGTLATGAVTAPPAAADGGGVVPDIGSLPLATFTVNPGVEQATVTGATPRAPLTLVRPDGTRIITLFTDALGQITFQYVASTFLVFDPVIDGVLPTTEGGTLDPGTYRVVSEGVPGEPFEGTVEASAEFTVLSVDDHAPTSLYEEQVLNFVQSKVLGGVVDGSEDIDGFGYIETRDGTLLSANIRLPDPGLYGPGPYPTVVQYSGYAPSRPGTPSGADAGGMLANVLGFAYVGVNLRGTGCSGGVFDVFNAAQAADAYDVIETVAREPWVKNAKVGMIGISYSGITQLYAAATQPPHLAAITPLSVIEDPWYQQWPGGIYNEGFTRSWLAQRDKESSPGGSSWVQALIDGGDATCESHMDLRSQSIDFRDFGASLTHRPTAADNRRLDRVVGDIQVPVFLAGAWQDEQTGSRFATMLDDFTGVPTGKKKFTVHNGHHPDGFSPLVMTRWFEFLSFYVDGTVPKVNDLVRGFSGPVLEDNFGVPNLGWEANRFMTNGVPTCGDFACSLAAYEAEQPVRALFEVGANPQFVDNYPLAHKQRFGMGFSTWPPPDAAAMTWYLGPDNSLTATPPTTRSIERFAFDPDVGLTTYNKGGDFGKINVNNEWKNTPDGKGLAYETAPLTQQMVIAGEGHVDLNVRTTGTDAGIELVLSEVYEDLTPDDGIGPEEVIVQHGLQRIGYRTPDPDRTSALRKDYLYFGEDYDPVEPGEWVNVAIPLMPVAHPFRAGSRIRLEINTPGGDRALWSFVNDGYGATTHDVGLGGATPTKLVLPVLPYSNPLRRIPNTFDEQTERPPCGSLRGQPCRTYAPLANEVVAADLSLTVDAAPDTVLAEADTTFTVTASNAGPDAATGVSVHAPVPTGTTLVDATPSAGTYDDVTGTWAVGTVNNGAAPTLTLQVTRASEGAAELTAEVTAAEEPDPDSTPGNGVAEEDDQATASATFDPLADLSLTAEVLDNPAFDTDDSVVVRVTAHNDGPSAADDVVAAFTNEGGPATVEGATPGSIDLDTGAWTLPTLASSGSAQLTLRFPTAADWYATFQVTSSSAADPDSQPAENAFGTPDLPADQDDEVVLAGTAPPAPTCGDVFPDVDDTNTFCAAISWLSTEDVAGGFSDGGFHPGAAVSRQAMAAFLYRFSGAPRGEDPTCDTAPFSDVPMSHPFCGEIDWLVDEGIAGGFEDGTFRPSTPISRQAMASFLFGLAHADAEPPACTEAPFTDVPTTHPFCGSIDWLASNGIASGFTDGSFRPASAISRQAMAAFLLRFHILSVV